MNITIRQLQAFVAVARSRSFAEACTHMHLSQPALSIAIKNLEEAVGGKLLVRTTRSVVLTPEGEEFYPRAKQLLQDWERSLEDVSDLFALRRGKLNIAAMPTFAGTLLPSILGRFQRRHPNINVTVHDVVAEQVLEMVRGGRVEVGITFDPGEQEDLDFLPLFSDRFMAAFPADHPLLSKKKLHWRDLHHCAFIALQRPSSIREQVSEMMSRYDVTFAPSFEAHQLVVVGRMVAEGLGVSVVPAISAGQLEEMGAVCRTLSPQISRNIGIVSHRRRARSTVSEALYQVIVEWAKPGE